MHFLQKKNFSVLAGILIICIAYLPVLSGAASIKFDALQYYYPIHYFSSNQLQLGSIPFWHYNLNGGFPLHADVGTPFWNFTLWIFPLLGNSVYMYTLSILLHIAIAAFGIYKLARYLGMSNVVAPVVMVCFVCSGFYAAHLEHPPYIFECAYIPFVVLFFLRTIFLPVLRNAVLLGISLFFLINSGYPGFCISTLYFLIFLFIGILVSHKAIRAKRHLLPVMGFMFCACAIGGILSSPLLVSYWGIANNYNHADGYSLIKGFGDFGGLTPRSLLSFIWPFASPVDASFYKTDATWNNIYCGIVLTCFFIVALLKSKQKLLWPIVIAGFFLLAMSFQGVSKLFFFKHLPLLSLVRNNGGFRIYFMLAVLLAGGFGLQYYIDKKWSGVKKITIFLAGVQVVAIVYLLLAKRELIFSSSLFHAGLRHIQLTSFNVPLMVFIQSLITIVLLLLAVVFGYDKRKIVVLIYADIVLSFLVNLPFTGINIRQTAFFTQTKIEEVATAINKIPYTKPMATLNAMPYDTAFLNEPVHFLKQNIGLDDAQYPSMFKNYSALYYSGKLWAYENRPCVYLLKQGFKGNDFKDFILKNNAVSFSIASLADDSLLIFQNYHPDWKGYVDGSAVAIGKNADGFITLPVSSGTHKIVIKYLPLKVIFAFLGSLLVWLSLLGYLWYCKKHKAVVPVHTN